MPIDLSGFAWKGPMWKPAKGSALLAKRQKRAEVLSHEKAEKAAVVARDGAKFCRLVPGCREREKFETAHLDDKGMGGDHGHRTTADTMVRACFWHHQGRWSLHSGDLRVVYLTDAKADGPIQVWGKGEDGREYLVKSEGEPRD